MHKKIPYKSIVIVTLILGVFISLQLKSINIENHGVTTIKRGEQLLQELQILKKKEYYQKQEESTLKNTTHELIIVISEQGYTNLIMDAARAAGAHGGTVIHAKGTGMEAAEKFMGVSLAAEKEIVFIVAKTEEKNAIMQAIMKDAGPDSKAKAITFSLPVTDTAGLRLIED